MPEVFNPRRVSPSRIGTYADCGLKFKYHYIDGISPERKGSAALFGLVMHRARERWVMDRSLDLIDLVRDAWVQETSDEPVIASFIREYAKLSGHAIRLEEQIRRDWAAQGKESKAPRMTAVFKKSDVARKIDALLSEWLPRLNETAYDFDDRDPLPALYDESLVLAWKYAEKYRALPNAYAAELAFDFEWEGFNLVGFIDDISPLIDRETGEQLGVGIVDAKTYKMEPDHEFKDWRQGVIYQLAFQHLLAREVLDHLNIPGGQRIYFGVDRMRLLDYRWFEPDERDVKRLLMELRTYQRGVENEVFLPASKTCKAKFCDFAKTCAFHHGNSSVPVELNVA